MQRIPLYVLNDFLKFDRKLYQIFGLPLGRPVRFKVVLYFIGITAFGVVLYFIPIFGYLIRWIPPLVLIVLAGVLSWLLADVGTEGRSPIYFFRSFLLYHYRRTKGISFYNGREVDSPTKHSFQGNFSYRDKHHLTYSL